MPADLVTRIAGVDDSTIQRGTWFKFANHDPSDDDEGFDEGSNEGSEVGVRSLSDSSYDRGSPASEKSGLLSREIAESKEEPDTPEAIEVPEAGPVPPAGEEISHSSKKKDRKFKVTAKRALYED
ncbi:hypothetical protein EPUS_09371 [Endocarpon pusillum Z07020]|uniref:Uncharacterized protein n=1 Tax=Endocarpon pusillum (strain Z07020 / HMAS-L-300199) TaxID=1263415 RepID=U1GFN2_ENDPU|nr:uncharacterized protein EPUS_09371 [Endocarpon pusillum Z07020]ERF76457.1 hypothetical protein EPUS_09371 [Endocarpon pusillum Z07020]